MRTSGADLLVNCDTYRDKMSQFMAGIEIEIKTWLPFSYRLSYEHDQRECTATAAATTARHLWLGGLSTR